MTEIISFEDTVNKSKVVNSTIKNNIISFEDTINSNNINSTIQNNNVSTISFEDTIVKKDNNEFTSKTTQQPSQLNIEYINQHPNFESSGGFDVRFIPDFDSIEDASAYYGLPVDMISITLSSIRRAVVTVRFTFS